LSSSTLSSFYAKSIKSIKALNSGLLVTMDPFLFGVYNKDLYPKGNDLCEAPILSNGQDFNKYLPYRM